MFWEVGCKKFLVVGWQNVFDGRVRNFGVGGKHLFGVRMAILFWVRWQNSFRV